MRVDVHDSVSFKGKLCQRDVFQMGTSTGKMFLLLVARGLSFRQAEVYLDIYTYCTKKKEAASEKFDFYLVMFILVQNLAKP